LRFGHWESMVCSAKIDMISPHFARHPTTLSDDSCSFMSLARRLDPRSNFPERSIAATSLKATNARLSTLVLVLYRTRFLRNLVQEAKSRGFRVDIVVNNRAHCAREEKHLVFRQRIPARPSRMRHKRRGERWKNLKS